jgi:hypothetical protein
MALCMAQKFELVSPELHEFGENDTILCVGQTLHLTVTIENYLKNRIA